MRKKAIAYEFLVRLLIAVIALAFVVSIASRCFRVTDEAEESFNRLADKIEEARAQEEGWTDSVRVDMDEGTAIYAFTSEAKELSRWGGDPVRKQNYVERFDECEENKTCICLCKEPLVYEKWSGGSIGREGCTNLRCRSLENVNLRETIAGLKLIPPGSLHKIESDPEIRGGFVFYRDQTVDTQDPYNMGLLQQNMGTRSRAVYVEKREGMIGVCLELPCV